MVNCRFATPAPEVDLVYGACAPGWDTQSAATIEEWIAFMQARGIERVCCLLSDRQLREYDDLLGAYESAFGPESVIHVPVRDHTLMQSSTLADDIVPVLDDAVAASEAVVVHCKAGIGRTGQALAGWLVHAHAYEPAEAIATVRDRHRRPDDAVAAGNATRDELLQLLASVA